MDQDLHDRDGLAWSEQQAALLRRLASGERVNGIDWSHVIEEIEDKGLSELNATRSYIRQILVHLLKLQGWPKLNAGQHWRAEVIAFQANLGDRFTPSMRQRIDLTALYAQARNQIAPLRLGGEAARASPSVCPVTLDQLLTALCSELEAAFPEA